MVIFYNFFYYFLYKKLIKMDFRKALLKKPPMSVPAPVPVPVPVLESIPLPLPNLAPEQGTRFTKVECYKSVVAGDYYRKRITTYCKMCFFNEGHHQKWDFVFQMITSSFPPSQEGFQKSVFSHLEGLGYLPSSEARFMLVR
jgi:hypothetical protein